MKTALHELLAFAFAAVVLLATLAVSLHGHGERRRSDGHALATRLEPVLEAGLPGAGRLASLRHHGASLAMPYFSFARLLRQED
ncbi:MAG: hypothetical protein QM601_04550 [Pseudoxanthomonas sp.]